MEVQISKKSAERIIDVFTTWLDEGIVVEDSSHEFIITQGIRDAIEDLKTIKDGKCEITTIGGQLAIHALMETIEQVQKEELEVDPSATVH